MLRKKQPVTKKATYQDLAYKTKEFPAYARNSYWYLGIGLLVVALGALAVSNHDWLFLLVVAAAALAIFRVAQVEPQAHEVRLTKKGVYWGKTFYAFHQLRAFWLANVGDQVQIYLERLNAAPSLSFALAPRQAVEAVNFLAHYLPWHQHRGEPLSDRLGRLLRF